MSVTLNNCTNIIFRSLKHLKSKESSSIVFYINNTKCFGTTYINSLSINHDGSKGFSQRNNFNKQFSQPNMKLKIYTKTGDRGKSSTFRGERFSKDDNIFEALGSIDELSAQIGVAKEFAHDSKHPYCDQLERIQCLLQDIGTCIAKAPPIKDGADRKEVTEIEMSNIEELETWIDTYTENLPELKNFILPGGGKTSSCLHVARTVCRRAERRVVSVVTEREVDSNVISFVNRLGDYLFTLARYASVLDKRKECIYISPESKKFKPAVNSETQTFSEV